MLRKILLINFIFIFGFISSSFAFKEKDHLDAFEKMKNTSTWFGGLKNINEENRMEINRLIDQRGMGGYNHRDNGSHDVKTVLEYNKEYIKNKGWNKRAVENSIKIHNILDMSHEGPEGTNGWHSTTERRSEAIKLRQKIANGERIFRFPEWSKKPGPNMKVTEQYIKFCEQVKLDNAVIRVVKSKSTSTFKKIFSYKYKNLMETDTMKQIVSKTSIVVDNTPKCIKEHGGAIIYVLYEGGSFAYRVKKNDGIIDWNKEISNAIGIAVGFYAAELGMKMGLIICTPLEVVGGPIAHIGSAIVISIGCGVTGEYVSSKMINYIKVKYV